MKPWVKEKLARIEELYPPERIQKSKKRWHSIWSGKTPCDRYPFAYLPRSFNYYDDVFTKEEGLEKYLDEFILRGAIDDDFIPAFFPGCRTATIPNMFGAEEVVQGNDHACKKIIFAPEDIDNLPEPSMAPGTIAHEWLDMQKYYMEETEGRIPIHPADMQGPLDICGQLWGYDNILAAPYDEEPEYYDKLMSKATAAYIMFWKAQRDLLGDCFVGTHLFGWDYVPPNNGASLSADSMAMISPGFFDEYYKPYLNEIGNALGSLAVHSCGNFSAVIKDLCAIEHVKAVNAGQMSIEEMLSAGLDSKMVVIAQDTVMNAEQVFGLVRKHNLLPQITFHGLWDQAHPEAMHKQMQEWASISG